VGKLVQIPLSGLILSGELKKQGKWQIISDKGEVLINPISD